MWFRRNKDQDGDSQKALDEAKQKLQDIQSRGPEVTKVAEAVKLIRTRNHFAEQLKFIIIGNGGDQ